MSQDLETIRRAYESWNESWGSSDLEIAAEFLHPDIQVDAVDRVFIPDHYRGLEGFQRFLADLAEVWDYWQMEPQEFIETGGRVVVVARARARGRGSGVELDGGAFHVWTMRGGKATRITICPDRETALQAARLEEPETTN